MVISEPSIIFSLSVYYSVSLCETSQTELQTGIFITQPVIYSHFLSRCGDYGVYFGV